MQCIYNVMYMQLNCKNSVSRHEFWTSNIVLHFVLVCAATFCNGTHCLNLFEFYLHWKLTPIFNLGHSGLVVMWFTCFIWACWQLGVGPQLGRVTHQELKIFLDLWSHSHSQAAARAQSTGWGWGSYWRTKSAPQCCNPQRQCSTWSRQIMNFARIPPIVPFLPDSHVYQEVLR